MLDRCNQLLFGCLACLMVTSVVNADGRVFVLDLRNSSGPQAFRDAERACASLHARLASSAELRHAVMECFFSPCTRGWLYGGTVGTTVCNVVGGALKAVDVRTENATEDAAHLDAFCVKDKGVPCGDPPSFPNARLQAHSGYEMGDELLYTCVPGYVMPSGHRAFSLLCDSCGEWYGLVEICVKDDTESHIDYEDKFPDSYGEAEHDDERPEEAKGEVYEEVHGAVHPEGTHEQQETSLSVTGEEEHQEQEGEHEVEGEETGRTFQGAVEGDREEERAVEDFIGHPTWEQERREVVTATEAPVSLLSQKHLFWFPSEAFQDEGHPVSTNPVTQTTQRTSGIQSEESKENESQERHHHYQKPDDTDDHDDEPGAYDDHDSDDRDDHDDLDAHNDSHHDDQDDPDHQSNDDHVKHHIPAERNHDDHDDHYDMGEHDEDRDRIRYGGQEYDDRDDTYDEHESYEDHEDVTEDQDDDQEHPAGSKEHPDHDDHDDQDDHDDHDDGEEHYDQERDDDDRYTDHDDHHDHHDHHDHDGHEHGDHDSYDDHESHEDVDDSRHHVIFSIATDRLNITQKREGGKATTDDTWLDGYPVEDTTDRPEDRERGAVVRITDKPNEVEIRGPVSYTSLPEVPQSPTTEPALEQEGVEEMWPGLIPITSSPDSPLDSDTLDYDTQQVAPTHSWLDDLTDQPFISHDPSAPVHDILMEGNTVHDLPGETGERGEMEGEMGETMCTGEDCPPPTAPSRGPKVAAIIVVLCAIVTAVIVGVWCYRRQQQKSSMYEMNGKGQSPTTHGQQIEMQQKV